MVKKTLLSIQNLKTWFKTSGGMIKAVDGVSFDIKKAETVGLAGESGSGKTVTALSIMRLVPGSGRIIDGSIYFEGKNLIKLSEIEMRKIRGGEIAMTFQDPLTYLNPVMRVGDQISEAILLHQKLSKSEARRKAIDVMELVEIPSAQERSLDYPHQLSGGMRQRVLFSMALSCQPRLLIADEPTTALDVVTQGEILELTKNLKNELGSSILWITHDLGILAELADRIVIMYCGEIMEINDTISLFSRPMHPYTMALLEAVPRVDFGKKKRLKAIAGSVPSPSNPPSGCKFHPRCTYAETNCCKQRPRLTSMNESCSVACLRLEEIHKL